MRKLSLKSELAAAMMRRLPIGVRRVRVWRDQMYRALGAGGWDEDAALDATWPSNAPVIKGRVSRMKMSLNLTDWMERRSFFTGRFYQEDIEDLLTKLVRPGDNFVDVGANVGLISLHAASLVGVEGKLWAFEPNPTTFAKLQHNVAINQLHHLRTVNCGLGVDSESLQLNLYGEHSGKATLVGRTDVAHTLVPVEIRRGDQQLADMDASVPTTFKIDVEGFEVSVLEGLGQVLDGNVAVVIEISPTWLDAAGSSAQALFRNLNSHGLSPYLFELKESRFKRRLMISRMDECPDGQFDCLFIRPGSVFANRLGLNA